ncbi:MAG: AMP-binding protein [Actinobacteria bacterium]|nr:AMP-binding protein [Actinomycetota bacterium]
MGVIREDGLVSWPDHLAESYRINGYWQGRTFAQEIESWAARDSAKVALIDSKHRFSYGDLASRSATAACRLRSLGLCRGERILVQLPNRWELVMLTLACWRAGMVPVMALPAHRRHELSHVAALGEVSAIATSDHYRGFDHQRLAFDVAAEISSVRHVLIAGGSAQPGATSLSSLLAAEANRQYRASSELVEPSLGEVSSQDIALFLLSGGTTGLPKLIPRTHDDYLYNARCCAEATGITSSSVYLVVLPASHNFPLACPGILGTFHAGGTVVLVDSPEPSSAFEAIKSNGVTHTAVVPAIAKRWMEAVTPATTSMLESLLVLQVGGARIADDLARQVKPSLGCTLQQVFGMAEGLINMTRLDDPEDIICATQGRPVSPADEIAVVDGDTAPVPEGRAGMLITRGPYTLRGYYRAPEANASSFTTQGWYRSGDIVRLHPSGNLVVEGRDKDIINRGGEKISAEEVENFAYQHPSVTLAAAVAAPDPDLGERIWIYVTLRAGTTITLDELKAIMETKGAARFKMPERLVVLPELPVTAVGKIDKRRLRMDAATRVTNQSNIETAQTIERNSP